MPMYFQFPSTYAHCTALVADFNGLAADIFAIFGINNINTTPQTETKEYTAHSGWFSFPCKDFIYRYQQLDYHYIIQHETMYNGHLGDTEENISILLKNKENSIDMRINCLQQPFLLSLNWAGFDEKLDQLEFFLMKHFNLSVVNQEDTQGTNNDEGLDDLNYNSHYLHK